MKQQNDRPDIAAIRERCEKATAGPWFHDHWERVYAKQPERLEICHVYGHRYEQEKVNREFIAHAREDIPALLAHIEAVEGLVREYGLRHKAECASFAFPAVRYANACTCGLTARLAELGLEK